MQKKVAVDSLRVGMYLRSVVGSWISNPFWRSSFLITDTATIDQLRNSRVAEVWIDTDKGLDVASEAVYEPTAPMPLEPAAEPGTQRVTLAEELQQATRICGQGKQAVQSMFREARLGHVVDARGATELVQEISDSVARNASALISLARIKTADDYTFLHSIAVCAMMIALARELGLSEEQTRSAGMAGLLHDLGKAAVPTEVLNKPGKLTAAELAVVRKHPRLGYNILAKDTNIEPDVLDVCLHHHERFGGGGYPDELRGEAISLVARMGAVCDVYDAVTSNRPYKAGWDPAESIRMMGQWTPEHFDPVVFQAFTRSLGIYPVGSLVRLTSGRLGVVAEQSQNAPAAPILHVFFSTSTMKREPVVRVDLSLAGSTERIVAREDPARWKFPDLDALWLNVPAA